jgi:hypothetical protein
MSFYDELAEALENDPPDSLQEVLLNAAFLFEKATLAATTDLEEVGRSKGWPSEVIEQPISEEGDQQLRSALTRFILRARGHPSAELAVWALSKGGVVNSARIRPLMILVAGPYRSGTNDDPVKMEAHVTAMTEAALRLYRAGHLPVVGEWFALPLVEAAGSQKVGDALFQEIFHPIAHRILERCDACLRIGGASQGADEMVRTAQAQGKQVFYRLEEVPGCA